MILLKYQGKDINKKDKNGPNQHSQEEGARNADLRLENGSRS
jgi:hypothetical protein